jgi:hypothetical protein
MKEAQMKSKGYILENNVLRKDVEESRNQTTALETIKTKAIEKNEELWDT